MNDPSLSEEKFLSLVDTFIEYRDLLLESESNTLDNRIKIFRLRQLISESKHKPYLYPVTQNRGFHFWLDLEIPDEQNGQFQKDFKVAMQMAISNMKIGMKLNKVLPDKIVTIIISQCLSRILECKDSYLRSVLKNFVEFLTREYHGRSTIGLHDLTHSDEEYEHYIFYETTLNMTALSIHEIGLKEMQITVNKLLNFNCKTHTTIMSHQLHSLEEISCSLLKSEYLLRNGKQISLHNIQRFVHSECKVDFELCTISDPQRPHAFYIGASCDNKQCGKLVVNLAFHHDIIHIPNLIAHELLPGHHLEVSNNLNNWCNTDMWYFTHFSSYIEGWALYAESLAAENVQSRPHKIHELQMELLRDVRMVIDSGIHSHSCGKWTFDDAYSFLKSGKFRSKYIILNFTGLPLTDNQIKSEIFRCTTRPAYSVSYKIGKIYFSHWKKMAEKRGFTPKEINDIFLSRRVPLKFMGELFSDNKHDNKHDIKHDNKQPPVKDVHKEFFTKSIKSQFSPTHERFLNYQLMQACNY